ncbi:MAG: glutamine-dependent synthetase [Actinomycetota bacterium]
MASSTTRTLSLCLAQINPTVGDVHGNAAKALAAYRSADEAGCDLVAFPELTLTGYPPEDLVLKAGFVADNQTWLEDFAAKTGDCIAVIGFVDGEDGVLYNAAAICHRGRVVHRYYKNLLPNYSVFDEERYFTPGDDARDAATIYRIGGALVGVTICEDIWSPVGPVAAQARAGASLAVSINASPFHRGRLDERTKMIVERAKSTGCTIAYVNQMSGQDELVFDGGSMIVGRDGSVLARSPQFEELLLVTSVELPFAQPAAHATVIDITDAPRGGSTHHAATLAPVLDDRAQIYGALVVGTRDYVRKNGFSDVVIGLSGGIDSALVAAVAVDALGAEHVHGVSMPSRYSSEGSRSDAAALASNLGIEMRTISIEPAFAAYLEMTSESFAGRAADLTEENLQSRVRGTTLMALSNKFNWMVLTTGNKSELAVGYFTLYGDSVGGYAVIKDVLKTTVYDLCAFVNERAGREIIPSAIITKPPSAELRPDQRDDQSLPPYEVLDPILELYVERDRTAAEIISMGHDEALMRRIARLVDMNEYKRRQGPPGVRVTRKAFGKDRRLPITNGYRG